MRDLLAGSTAGADRNLWLVTPDTWPRGLPVVWLVMGKTPDHPGSITIPIEADRITAVVNALSRRHPVAERCDTCRLWRRLTAESGECHALAPQPVLYDPGVPATAPPPGGLRVAWPRTTPGGFCGEWSPLPVRPERPDRPRKVCLCGSTRFKQAFIKANFLETMAGHIVLSVGWFSHADAEVYAPTEAEKQALDDLHLRKIDDADEVLVINPRCKRCLGCGRWGVPILGACPPTCTGSAWEEVPYVGESTRREIAYAEGTGKPVRYLEPPEGGQAT